MKKSWLIFLIIIGIVVGIFSVFLLLSGDEGGELSVKEIKDIANGTYFEISIDELKEHPEIIKTIHGGEGCVKSDYSGWTCKLNSYEVGRFWGFFNRKHAKYLFSVDLKFRNNLNKNTVDTELIKMFKANGFPLSEKYSTLAVSRSYARTPYDWWFVNENIDTSVYTIYDINNELKVYKVGYIEYQFVKIGEKYYEIHLGLT